MDAMHNLMHNNDHELHDLIDDLNFDQFINSIHGENEDLICNFGSDLNNDCFIDNHIFDHETNDNNNNIVVNVHDPILSSTLSSLSYFNGKLMGEGEEENDGVDSSSAATTTTETTTNAKSKQNADRSKTLISERRRRGRMKDKLYALRSLVPNITKMDKASIIGDAVEYVHGLQAQAKKLKSEVSGLETSLLVSEKYEGSINNSIMVHATYNNHSICKKILQMDMFEVEERGYYAKIVSNKGEGVAASLYKALESLTGFNVHNSNLATVCDSFLLTFTLNVEGSDPEINLPNLKLWVTGALVNQGFEVMPFFHAQL
ncbi:hypothetical protein TanjilG_04320 [Lupinus angustifolius]|uniref:BHLH domain-containing protein n=2 Tax=Lupinus angustifolius TaxID=3871 RepID=A0A4P1RQ87_LUPAN|nr:hypothetical protein TanjilG_04320 [Lupinus angustifolius]